MSSAGDSTADADVDGKMDAALLGSGLPSDLAAAVYCDKNVHVTGKENTTTFSAPDSGGCGIAAEYKAGMRPNKAPRALYGEVLLVGMVIPIWL